jgi:predicted enzyme related to lactoylglutathione lyase
MINGVHLMLYSHDAAADRAFLRDELGWPHVEAGEGWLIFKLPPAEIGVHPGESGQEFYLMCDDLEATVVDLMSRGVEVVHPASRRDWGMVTTIRLPGGSEIGLYQPFHQAAHDL